MQHLKKIKLSVIEDTQKSYRECAQAVNMKQTSDKKWKFKVNSVYMPHYTAQ